MKYLTTSEVADMLGLGRATINRMVNEGRFPNVLVIEGKERNTIRIPLSDVEALKQKPKEAS